MLSFQVFILLVVALINAAVLWLIIAQGLKNLANRYFAASILFIILWVLGTAIFYAAPNRATADFGIMLFYVSPMLSVMFLNLFSSVFRTKKVKKFDALNIVLVAGTILSAIAIIIPPALLTDNIEIVGNGNNRLIVDSAWYLLYVVYFDIAFLITFFKLYLGIKSHISVERKQFIFIFIGTLLTAVFSFVTNLVLPLFGNSSLIWLGPTWSLFYVATVSFSIIRHGLFDIRRTVVRTVAYAMSLLVLAMIYYLLAYIVSVTLFQGQTSATVSLSPINILLALLLAFMFQPIKAFFDRTTDRIFFRDRYVSHEFYARLSEVLTSSTDLRTLLEKSAIEVGTTMKSEQAFFFVQYNHSHKVTAGTHRHASLPTKDIKDINQYIQKHGSAVIVGDLLPPDLHLKRILISHKIAVLMPLVRHKDVLGYLCLGEQLATGYTSRDIRVLNTISDELVIAIQNSLSVQEVRDTNIHLEQRIAAATAELRTSNARLRRLDASKDEFLSMASHQLRTPLTSVKGYLSMMLDGDMGKLTKMQKQVLDEAFSSSERMVHLIHDFLNVSRLQTGKFMLELTDVNVPELIKNEVKSLERVAASRNMKLEVINNVDELTMRLDDTKIRQVVMNYIDNAIYYSHPDSTIEIILDKTDSEVLLKVKDTGIGVPKSEQDRLFGKFFRATNARKQRPDGTGVGIFLAKKVISALGGEIIFESKEGKGSTFGFRLPLVQDEAALKDQTKQLEE